MIAIIVGILALSATVGVVAASSSTSTPGKPVAMAHKPKLQIRGTLNIKPDLLQAISDSFIKPAHAEVNPDMPFLREFVPLKDEPPSVKKGINIAPDKFAVAWPLEQIAKTFLGIDTPSGVYLGIGGTFANFMNLGAGKFRRAIFMNPDAGTTEFNDTLLEIIRQLSQSGLSTAMQRYTFLSIVTLCKTSRVQLEKLAEKTGDTPGSQMREIANRFRGWSHLDNGSIASDFPRALQISLQPVVRRLENAYRDYYAAHAMDLGEEEFHAHQRDRWLNYFVTLHSTMRDFALSMILSDDAFETVADLSHGGLVEFATGTLWGTQLMPSISAGFLGDQSPPVFVYLPDEGQPAELTPDIRTRMEANLVALRDAIDPNSGLFWTQRTTVPDLFGATLQLVSSFVETVRSSFARAAQAEQAELATAEENRIRASASKAEASRRTATRATTKRDKKKIPRRGSERRAAQRAERAQLAREREIAEALEIRIRPRAAARRARDVEERGRHEGDRLRPGPRAENEHMEEAD